MEAEQQDEGGTTFLLFFDMAANSAVSAEPFADLPVGCHLFSMPLMSVFCSIDATLLRMS